MDDAATRRTPPSAEPAEAPAIRRRRGQHGQPSAFAGSDVSGCGDDRRARTRSDVLEPLLFVGDVMARYRFRDRMTAIALIKEANGFKAGRQWAVRASDLAAWETTRAGRFRDDRAGSATQASAVPRRHRRPRSAQDEPLARGWWQ